MTATPPASTFDHVTILVTDLDEALRFFAQLGMVFRDRKLVFFSGPGDTVIELAEWL